MICNVLYSCYWVRVTPIPAIPRLTRWHKQCLESGSKKATQTRYRVRVTFSDWLSEHSSGAAIFFGLVKMVSSCTFTVL